MEARSGTKTAPKIPESGFLNLWRSQHTTVFPKISAFRAKIASFSEIFLMGRGIWVAVKNFNLLGGPTARMTRLNIPFLRIFVNPQA
jgi:hypothetical protein